MPISQLRAACILATAVTIAIILYESTQARGEPGVVSLTTNEAYVGHFAIYALLAFSAMAVFGRPTPFSITAVVLISACLGVALELYQAGIPTRSASIGDAVADAAGSLFGVFAYVLLTARIQPDARQQPKKL